MALTYTYDDMGRITQVKRGGSIAYEYEYNHLNQLDWEKDRVNGKISLYWYDNGGNISRKRTWAYEYLEQFGVWSMTDQLSSIDYGYTDSNWKDKLTSYNGQTITYDAIGNPLSYRDNMSFTWQNGRQLSAATYGNTSASYKYSASGIRTQKTIGGNVVTDYLLSGSNILMQKTGNDVIWYLIDGNGAVVGFELNNVRYLYMKNAQGDVIGITNDAGDIVVKYEYDAWGVLLSTTGSLAGTVGVKNPLRYRGYYYDTESGLYYLNSRYYDPVVGRFVNADGLVQTGNGLLDKNMFAYCGNDPVNMCDPTGNMSIMVLMFKILVGTFLIDQAAKKKNVDSEKVEFSKKIYFSACIQEFTMGVPASITTAQAIYESGYGKQTPKDKDTGQESYNLFGIKGAGPAGSVKCWTYEKDKTERIIDSFRAYNNFSESLTDHSKLLSNSRYGHLKGKTVEKWAYGLQDAGYCQDSDYGDQLMNVIAFWDLL